MAIFYEIEMWVTFSEMNQQIHWVSRESLASAEMCFNGSVEFAMLVDVKQSSLHRNVLIIMTFLELESVVVVGVGTGFEKWLSWSERLSMG